MKCSFCSTDDAPLICVGDEDDDAVQIAICEGCAETVGEILSVQSDEDVPKGWRLHLPDEPEDEG